MNDTPELIAKLRLDTTDAEKDVKSFGKSLAGIGAALGAVVSTAAIVSALKKSVEAAMDAEKSTKAFNAALQSLGAYSKEISQDFQNFAGQLQRTTGVSDDLILKNSALLVSLGKLSGGGLKGATQAALDLAAGMQIDVSQAFDIVTKAAIGNIATLSKYGLEVRKGASDSEKFAAAIDFINQRFGGQAAGNMKTFTGALNGFSNALGDVFEEIGKLFTQSPMFRALIIEVTKLLIGASDSINKFGKSGDVVGGLIDKFFTLGSVIVEYVIKPIEAISNVLATGLAAIPTLIVNALSPVVPLMDKILGTEMTEKVELLRTALNMTTTDLANTAYAIDTSFSDRLKVGLDDLRANTIATAQTITDELGSKVPAALTSSLDSTETFFSGFKDGLKDLGGSISNLGRQVSSTFVAGFSNAFAQVGKALVEGSNAFGAFGKAILSMLGNIAMQMGSFYIAAGIAAMFLNPAQGSGMIAAGIGLSVLGGVLQALGGGGAGGGVGATQAGTVSGGGQTVGLDPTEQMAREEERNAPNTGINVTVMGNVLDRRETGLYIAEVIQESFDTQGVTVRGMA